MSQVVDSKVVEMRFDNEQFAKGVNDTLAILDKLKTSLNFEGAVQTVQAKFSAMDTVITTTLANITNSAVNAGKHLADSLTVDNIRAGWEKFGNKTSSVATLVSQGYELEDVNNQLERLNWFTDETSYNFTDMVGNIAKFTATGQDLETSVTAMEGIANWAALSGQNAQKASMAMYQLSQAMGKGALKYDDYKSIQNASMDTQEFRQHCLDAAVALGTLKKNADDTYAVVGNEKHSFDINGFSKYLSTDAWLTSDVMMNVFNQYSAAVGQIYDYAQEKGITASEAIKQLGDKVDEFGLKAFKAAQEARTWSDVVDATKDAVSTSFMHTFEIIFGNYEEATKLWTGMANAMYDIFAEPVNSLNEWLEGAFQGKGFLDETDFNKDLTKIQDRISDPNAWTALQKLVGDTAKAHGVALDEMIEKEGSFEATLKNGWLTGDIFNEAISKITGSETETAVKNLDELREAALGVIRGDYGNDMEARFAKLAEEGFDPQQVQDYVNVVSKLTNGTWDITDAILEEADAQAGNIATIESMSDAQLKELGYTDEQIIALRRLAKQAEETGTPLNELMTELNRPTGRELFIDSFKNAFQALGNVMGLVGRAWRSVFPATTSEQLYALIEGVHKFTENLSPSLNTSYKLVATFRGLFNALSIVKQAFTAFGSIVLPVLAEALGEVVDRILSGTTSLSYLIGRVKAYVEETDIFVKVAQTIASALRTVFSVIFSLSDGAFSVLTSLFSLLKEKIVMPGWSIVLSILERVGLRFSGISDAASQTRDKVSNIFQELGETLSQSTFVKALQSLWNIVKSVGAALFNVLGSGLGFIAEKLANADFNGIIDLFNSIVGAGIGVTIFQLIKDFKGAISDFTDKDGNGVVGILNGVKDTLSAFQEQLKAGVLMKIATAIAVLAGSLFVISLIDSDKLAGALGAISVLIGELVGTLKLISETIDDDSIPKAGKLMIALAASVLILAFALKKVGSLDTDQLTTGLLGITGLIALLVGAIEILSLGEAKAIEGAGKIILFAAAVWILASACKSLSSLNWEELGKGLVGVGVLLAEISIFLRTAKFDGKMMSAAAGMVIFALAIKLLTGSVKTFAAMDVDELKQGLLTLGAILAEMAIFMRLSGDPRHMISMGIGFIAIAAAMKMLVGVIQSFGSMSTDELSKGLITLAASMAVLTVAVNFMPKGMVGIGVGLIAVSAGLLLLVKAFGKLGKMKWSSIAKGLVAMGGALAIIVVAVNAMKGTLAGAAAILVVSAALLVLTPVLMLLGSMPLANIGKALLALAGVFVILGVAAAVLSPLIPAILGLAAAIAVLGVAIVAIGVGLAGVGAGIYLLVRAIVEAIAMVANIQDEALKTFIDFIPKLAPVVAKAIVAICDAVVEAAPAIGEAVKALVLMVLDVLDECAPRIVESFFNLIITVLDGMITYVPQIVSKLLTVGALVLDEIAKNIPMIIQSVMNLFGSIFKGITDALGEIDTNALTEIVLGIGALAGLMVAMSLLAGFIPGAMVGILGLGIVIAELGAIFLALGALAQIPGITWLVDEGSNFADLIGHAIGSFIGNIIGGIAEGATSTLPQIGTHLADFMTNAQPFFDGISAMGPEVFSSVGDLATAILKITAADLLEGIAGWITGESSISSFAKTLPELGSALTAYADNLGESLNDTTKIDASTNLASLLATLAGSEDLKTGGVMGFIKGESIGLDKFGEQLPTLATGLASYAELINTTTFDPDKIDASINLASLLASLAGDDNLKTGGVLGFIKGESDLSEFGKDLVPLAMGLTSYAMLINTTTFDQDKIDASINLASLLASLAGEESLKKGGVLGFIEGESDLSEFGKQLVPLATGLSSYAALINTTTFDQDKINASINMASMLASLAGDEIPEGGVIGWLKGNSDKISVFAEQLPSLAEGLSTFADSMADMAITDDQVELSGKMASMLANLASNEIPDGGIFGWLSGNDDKITNFAKQLPALGTALKAYSDNLGSDMDATKIETAGAAANMIAELQKAVGDVNYDGFLAKGDLTKFGEAIVSFGGKLKEFSDVEINTERLASISESAKSLVLMANRLKNTNPEDMSKFDDILNSLTSADWSKLSTIDSTKLTEIATAINDFVDTIDTSDEDVELAAQDLVTAAANALVGEKTQFEDAGKVLISNLKNGLSNEKKLNAVKDAMGKLMSSTLKKVTNKSKDFEAAGAKLSERLKAGIDSYDLRLKYSFSTALSAALTSIYGYYSYFYNAGSYVVSGFISGISANTYKAEIWGAAVAQAAVNAAQRVLDINSPSKVFYKIGSYSGEGFVNALADYVPLSYNAGKDVALSAKSGLARSMGNIADLVSSGFDIQPTISPVLDLSNVRSGVGAIDSMLTARRAIGLTGGINAINTAMANRNQNATNDDVISAIDALGRQLQPSGNTYNTINGITYDDGSNITEAIRTLVRAARIERRA